MKRKQKSKHISNLIISLILLVTSVISGGNFFPAFAAADSCSSVLDDLTKDTVFSITDYPYIENDYSLQIIQIAEGSKDELFIYVYQPTGLTLILTATSINMSLSEEADETRIYDLTLISAQGVFQKYIVNDFVIRKDNIRYYNISTVYRAWDGNIDAPSPEGNEINEIGYSAGILFTAKTAGDTVGYSRINIDYIEIKPEDMYVGYITYPNGFTLYPNRCNSHYVAFKTDRQIDKLEEADVSYVARSYHYTQSGESETKTYGESKPDKVTLYGNKSVKHIGQTLISYTYEWKEIESVEEFINNPDYTLKDSVKNRLQDKQWVLRFCATDYNGQASLNFYWQEGTDISEVTILRLKFKTDGKTYNLGVVSNKVTNTDGSSNVGTNINFTNWLDVLCKLLEKLTGIPAIVWKIIIIAIPIIIVLSILAAFIPPVANALLFLLKCLWLVISAPFRFIGWIIGKARGE